MRWPASCLERKRGWRNSVATTHQLEVPKQTKLTIKLHPAEQYARDVISGKIAACKWVRLACERHVHDLKHAHRRGFVFSEEAAQYVLDFIGQLRHSKGKWGRGQGEHIRLEPWQQFIIWVS